MENLTKEKDVSKYCLKFQDIKLMSKKEVTNILKHNKPQ
jgi:hypothetical protein